VTTRPAPVSIRRATASDGGGIGDVWLTSWRATFDFPPAHPDDDVRRWLAEELLTRTETWVAVEPRGRVVALIALGEATVEQLYVAPDWFGRGVGGRLLDLARTRRPHGLELFCFQINRRARAFYEHRGFVPIAYGDGSGNDEHQPDVLYRWRP
jgi:GNAT superfamily N-acetyltransferase